MPKVEFHILSQAGADARLRYACQLVAEAQQHAQGTFVRCTQDGELDRVDELLWTFREHAFIPHEAMTPQAPSHPRIVALLGLDEALPATHHLLINLGDGLPAQWSQAERIVEVVDAEPARKQAARDRYKLYRDQGCELETINIEQHDL